MKLRFKNIIAFIVICMVCIFVIGCGGGGEKEPEDLEPEFNEVNYQIGATYEFSETLDILKTYDVLDAANKVFNDTKNYSYMQTINGTGEEEYKVSGKTIIDVSGDLPKASMNLAGSLEFGFYVTDNKAYINMNGVKTYTEVKKDLSDLIEDTQGAIGAFVSFDKTSITGDNFKFAGIDKHGVTVIEYEPSEIATATIIIFDGQIRKVLYDNLDQIEYSALYSYEKAIVELPSDLDTYTKKTTKDQK